MTADDRVITLLAEANPVPSIAPQGPHEHSDAERILRQVLSSPPGRRQRPPVLVPALAVLVALVVVGVFLSVGGSRRSPTAGAGAGAGAGAVQLVLHARPTAQTPVVTAALMSREAAILRERLSSAFHDVQVTRMGNNEIVVVVRDAGAGSRPRILALSTTTAHLYFYDWEADALTPNGKTVASQLQTQDPTALRISQGSSAAAPGGPGAGGMSLYAAVKLASKQPAAPARPTLARPGPQYYMFGAPGSPACAAAANAPGTSPIRGAHCLLAGPGPSLREVVAELPSVTGGKAEPLVVPQGTVVLQASNPSLADQVTFSNPAAQFYVLKDNVPLSAADITHPRRSADQAGSPDVTFGFTGSGQRAFRNVTAKIAQRGNLVSSGGLTLNQHFAVVLDQQLITVPSIDFKVYPDGVTGGGGADITGGFSHQSASDLATELRLGALPVPLAACAAGQPSC
jgi:SecD/SecF fusion protein